MTNAQQGKRTMFPLTLKTFNDGSGAGVTPDKVARYLEELARHCEGQVHEEMIAAAALLVMKARAAAVPGACVMKVVKENHRMVVVLRQGRKQKTLTL